MTRAWARRSSWQRRGAAGPGRAPDGCTPRWFTYFTADAHIYEHQIDMLREQQAREPLPVPRLVISERVPSFAATRKYEPEWLETIEPSDFALQGHQHHAPQRAPLAV